jgi:NodT family efflux transporter outer membrane factor (OMF) lipoprotein
VPTALPADLLGRRADIVAQRLRIEVANADITVANAEFYPNVDLTAFFGFQSLGTSDLLKSGSRTYGAGPALHLPIFNRSSLRANLGAREADYDLAVAEYNQTVLDAVRDAADQGTALRSLAQQRAAADNSLAALQRAHDLSQLRYQRGLVNRLEVLDSEAALLTQQRALAALRERELQASLGLIKALGGGYAAPATAQNITGEQNGR